MEDSKRKLSPLLYLLIGLTISAILGWAVSQLLLGEPQPYRINWLWRYTILFYCLTGSCTIWFYFVKNFLPILFNLLKFIGGNLFFSLPYFALLILTKALTINSILIILPAQVILLAGGFILYISMKFDPNIGEYSKKFAIKSFLVALIVMTIAVFLNMTEILVLSLAAIIMVSGKLYIT